MLEHSGQHMRQSGNEPLSVCGLSNLADYRQGAGGRLAMPDRCDRGEDESRSREAAVTPLTPLSW